jgi:thioredoxin-like negative regulator of GroEL
MWGEIYVAAARAQMGDDSAVDRFDRIYEEARARGFDYIRSNCAFNRVIPACFSLRAASNLELLEDAQRVVERSGPHFPALARGLTYSFLGRNHDAERELLDARRIADERGYLIFVLRADYILGYVLTSLDRAAETIERLGPERNDLDQQEWMWHKVAQLRALNELGRNDDAIAARPDAPRRTRLSGARSSRITFQVVRALIAAGRVRDAVAELDETKDEYQMLTRAAIALAQRETDRAIAPLRAAAARWREAQYKDDEAEARLLLAETLSALGESASAAAELELVIGDAEHRGGLVVLRKAHELASRLGVSVESPASASASSCE